MDMWKVIYDDAEIMVVYKSAGLATQSSKIGQADLVSLCRKKRMQEEKTNYIGLVHRLDQPVEGLLVLGKTPQATAALSAQLQKEGLGKSYYAVVVPTEESMVLSQSEEWNSLKHYLKKDVKTNSSCVVEKSIPDAKEARLKYRLLEKKENCYLADVQIETGRHHQIRVQMSAVGLPLLGDQKYGTPRSNELTRENDISQVCLCAYHLKFRHPKTKKQLEYRIHPQGKGFQGFSVFS